jgi:glycerol kinase
MPNYILCLDQGTTGSTALLLDDSLAVLGKSNREFQQHFPRPGWVEHHLDQIWASMQQAIQDVLQQTKIDPKHIACIGITNQRETVGAWDPKTGNALAPAIVWQCRRTADRCEQLKKAGPNGATEAMIFKKTGLVVDAYFSGTKIEWLLENVGGLREKAQSGAAQFGTIDSFLVHRLTAGEAHVTDVTNASRTMLCNIDTLAWDDELCALFKVPKQALPKIVSSAEIVGKTKGVPGLPDGIAISGIAGDQQSALFGQACFEPGMAKCTYGTGAFMLLNTGSKRKDSHSKLLTTVAWKVGNETSYALEGSVFIAGAVVQWLRDGLGFIESSAQIEQLAGSVPDSGGVVVVPAFAGLGAPYWRGDARGIITGITRGTTRAHIARAALEAIALQNFDVLEAMQSDAGALSLLRVDGGAAANNALLQYQADILSVPLSRPKVIETTAFGAGCLAAIGSKLFEGTAKVKNVWREDRRFEPKMAKDDVKAHIARWRKAVERA